MNITLEHAEKMIAVAKDKAIAIVDAAVNSINFAGMDFLE